MMSILSNGHPDPGEYQSGAAYVEGLFVGLDEERRPVVRTLNSEECVCRVASAASQELQLVAPGTEVPVLLLMNEQSTPIIVSVVQECIPAFEKIDFYVEPQAVESEVSRKTVILRADEELILGCGKSSLHLRKDGLVIIKGERITSRARQTQKIKGANVLIN